MTEIIFKKILYCTVFSILIVHLGKFISNYRRIVEWAENMKFAEAFHELSQGDPNQELIKKRFACASCGSTWVELVGLVVSKRSGKEDLCLRIGLESEACQMCRMKTRVCHECGSQDTYELKFEREVLEAPLNFRSIKTVNRVSGQ